jgi:hypothetical protein
MGERRVYTGFWWGNMGEGDHLKSPDVDGMVVLRMGLSGMGWVQDWINLAQDRETCICVKELSAFIKCGEFL